MRSIITGVLALSALAATAQSTDIRKEKYKFEKVGKAMLERRQYAVDSGAAAVVLADVGTIDIEGNSRGSFSYVLHRHRRVHLLNKNGYGAATFEIPLYKDGANGEDRITELKAYTYTLDGSNVNELRLPKDNVFKEKRNRFIEINRFTMPSLKEGCIVDIEYKVESNFIYNLPQWFFQGDIPSLWSDFTLTVPYFLYYVPQVRGYMNFYIRGSERDQEQYTVKSNAATTAYSTEQMLVTTIRSRWVARDVPAYRAESFLFRPVDHIGHLEFQLTGIKEGQKGLMIPGWADELRKLKTDVYFGWQLDRDNAFFNKNIDELRSADKETEARNAFYFIRNQMRSSGHSGYYIASNLREPFMKREGSSAEVNLLLASLLRKLGHQATPALLSTRDNGTIYGNLPMMSKINHVIVVATINNNTYYLDATDPRVGFGQLAPECYNGMIRLVDDRATPVMLTPGTLKDNKITNILINGGKGTKITGTVQQLQGTVHSYEARKLIAEKGIEAYRKEWLERRPDGVTFSHIEVDSVERHEQPLSLRADVSVEMGSDSLVYVDPFLGEELRENPFKSPERLTPVELGSAKEDRFMLTFFVPEGYKVEQLPKSQRIYLNERRDGMFEYLVSEADGTISIQATIQIRNTWYSPEEYPLLRNFFSAIVAAQQEKIILKKTRK